jgi:hypothetical protein
MKVLETYDNRSYDISDDQHQSIMRQSASGETKGIWIGGDYIAWGSIKAIHEKPHGYGQPYTELPARGFAGMLDAPKTKNAREAMVRGLMRARTKIGDAPNLDKLIAKAKVTK